MNDLQIKLVAAVILVLAVLWFLRKTGLARWSTEDDKKAYGRGYKDGYVDGLNGTYRANFQIGFWEHPNRTAVWKHHTRQWIFGYGEGYYAGYRRGRKRAKPFRAPKHGLSRPRREEDCRDHDEEQKSRGFRKES